MGLSIEEKRQQLKTDLNIIALSGKSNTGKTHCLQKLIFEFPNNSKFIDKSHKFDDLFKNGIPLVNNKNNLIDLIVVVEINNTKIGIITYGDDEAALTDSFYQLKDYECGLYVCACRTQGGTIKLLNELTENGKLIIHNRWAVSEESYIEKTMNYQVEEIKSEIEDILK